MAGDTIIRGTADFSPCGRFRWTLTRTWGDGPIALVCGANPSVADAERMDATMHRVVALLRPRGYGGFVMVNASPYVATDPRDHERWKDEAMRADYRGYRQVVNRNSIVLHEQARQAAVRIAAWGNLVKPVPFDLTTSLSGGGQFPIMCWGTTKDGAPLHPLARGKMRIPDGAPLVEWRSDHGR